MIPFFQPLFHNVHHIFFLIIKPEIMPHVMNDNCGLVFGWRHLIEIHTQERVNKLIHSWLHKQVRCLQIAELFSKIQHSSEHRECSRRPHAFLVNVRVCFNVIVKFVFAAESRGVSRKFKASEHNSKGCDKLLSVRSVEWILSDGGTQHDHTVQIFSIESIRKAKCYRTSQAVSQHVHLVVLVSIFYMEKESLAGFCNRCKWFNISPFISFWLPEVRIVKGSHQVTVFHESLGKVRN